MVLTPLPQADGIRKTGLQFFYVRCHHSMICWYAGSVLNSINR